jgi:hypothetical protein
MAVWRAASFGWTGARSVSANGVEPLRAPGPRAIAYMCDLVAGSGRAALPH